MSDDLVERIAKEAHAIALSHSNYGDIEGNKRAFAIGADIARKFPSNDIRDEITRLRSLGGEGGRARELVAAILWADSQMRLLQSSEFRPLPDEREDYRKRADKVMKHPAILSLASPAVEENGDVRARCDWPTGRFTFHDEPGEHDPCYVVMPGGASLPLNHHAGEGVDIARAKFIIAACNAALLSKPRYLSDHFRYAAPGDRQEDVWLVRFDDADRRDMLFRGDDAEAEAWAAWEQFAPSWNCYVFRLATLSTPTAPAVEDREAIRSEIVNAPETADFMAGVPLEAAHQRERWGVDHDAGKTPFDWFWLVGYLAQKAASSAVAGDDEKAKHHTISTAAALANWHAALTGADNRMRPGIADPIAAAPPAKGAGE